MLVISVTKINKNKNKNKNKKETYSLGISGNSPSLRIVPL